MGYFIEAFKSWVNLQNLKFRFRFRMFKLTLRNLWYVLSNHPMVGPIPLKESLEARKAAYNSLCLDIDRLEVDNQNLQSKAAISKLVNQQLAESHDTMREQLENLTSKVKTVRKPAKKAKK